MIITLCGSTRFMDSFHKYNLHLTLAGQIVFSMATYKQEQKDEFTEEEKKVLDLIHLAKIDASDAIFVINREFGATGFDIETYIGESTRSEIRYAAIKGKDIYKASNHDARSFVFDVLKVCRSEFAKGFSCNDDWKS